MENKGLRPYLYEYMFYRAVEQTKKNIGTPIMVSQARGLRDKVTEKLQAQGLSMSDPKLKISPVLTAFDEVFAEEIPGYKPLFGDHTTASMGYRQLSRDFLDMVGVDGKEADGSTRRAKPGALGVRLPVSPYDPRFAGRATVKKAGSALLFIPDDAIGMMLDDDVTKVADSRKTGLKLFVEADYSSGPKLVESGPAYTLDDMSGLSELMGFMSEDEYDKVRSWVIQGARNSEGRIAPEMFMTPQALERSVAILRELGEQGTPYTVERDRNPGQICAKITGTKIEVRLTETRPQERYVGRVYDDGADIYFTTTVRDTSTNKTMGYTPMAAECVSLLRLAQGRPVERTDGKGMVGEVATYTERRRNNKTRQVENVELNEAYYSGPTQSSMMGPLPGASRGHVLIRRDARDRTASSRMFRTAEDAETYLKQSVESARANLAVALDVDGLVQAAKDHAEEIEAGTWTPDFHGVSEVAAVQRSYWAVLTGRRSHLLTADGDVEQYNAVTAMVADMDFSDPEMYRRTQEMLLNGSIYAGDAEAQVRAHAEDVIDTMVGTFDPVETVDAETGEVVMRRFDPVGVSQHMTSEFGVWRNNDEIVAALRATDIDADELRGSSFYNTTIKDRMIRFDEASAAPMAESESPFIRAMGEHVRRSISMSAAEPKEILIDEAGVVRWTAERRSAQKESGSSRELVTGEIGQIFDRGDHGEIVTRFAGGENYLFVPGYEAHIMAQKAGETKSVEERTILRGYDQIMAAQIDYQVSSDLLTARTMVGNPTSLNGVYRRLYDVRHEVDFIDRSREEGLTDEWRDAILATEGRRVRYGNEIKEGSTINAEYQASVGRGRRDPSNDNFFDAWVVTGGRNMAIMTEHGDGYFDPMMTSGSTNQGITRYLVEGAEVTPEGHIVRGDVDDRTPLMKHPDAQFMSFSPFDRQQMTSSNLMQAAAVTPPVGTAMMTLGGWTMDDPMVVSERFAQNHAIRGADGQMRPLVVGDKLSDMHGNKGVISLIVDPQMTDTQARSEKLEAVVDVFRNNPELDVVMSPFSAVSRFNGGTAREMMQNTQTLHLGDREADSGQPQAGSDVEAGMGQMRFIVTHMAVDSKTRIYDEEDIAIGRGRKASSQLAWALGAQECDKVLAECYGNNSVSLANLREFMVTCGLDVEADGTLRKGWEEQSEADQRRLIEQPDLVLDANGGLDLMRMKRDFGSLIGDKGGDLEIPFPLKFPTGDEVPHATDGTWKVPVLSSYLRSGQDLGDGTSTVHDYTNHYLAIQEQALRYRFAQQRLADPTYTDPAGRKRLQAQFDKAQSNAQMAFNSITDDIKQRRFSGKHNIFRDQLMAARMPNSATAVWTSDPRLDIDQVAMGPKMAEALGFVEGDHALIWRDPMLRDAGVRYMRVAIDDRLHGVAINPVMDKCFDGDFDGDSVAVVKLNTKAAHEQAMEKLTVAANLLDLGSQDEQGLHELAMQNSLDVKVTQHEFPGVKNMFEEFKIRANDAHFLGKAGEMTPEEVHEERQQLVRELSDYYRDEALGRQVGGAVLRFADVEDHLQSVVESCVETGAKGSMSKVKDYAVYLGAELDDSGKVTDAGKTLHTRKDDEAVEYATAVKSFGTGVAGMFSQRGVRALRNDQLKAVLELTYPVTQSILQSKHDPVEARHKYEVLMGPARDLWKGRLLREVRTHDGGRTWEAARDDKGRELQADVETWKTQFEEIYTSKDGLNVQINTDNIELVAESLGDETGKMRDLEADTDLASPMDQMAYGGDFDTLVDLCEKRVNVYEGQHNAEFMPYAVRNNQRALAQYDAAIEARDASQEVSATVVPEVAEPEIEVIARKDTMASNQGREARRMSDDARAVGGRETWEEKIARREAMQAEVETSGDDYQM